MITKFINKLINVLDSDGIVLTDKRGLQFILEQIPIHFYGVEKEKMFITSIIERIREVNQIINEEKISFDYIIFFKDKDTKKYTFLVDKKDKIESFLRQNNFYLTYKDRDRKMIKFYK